MAASSSSPSFHIPLSYDAISTKARMNGSLKRTLHQFFASIAKDHTKSFLRVSSNSRSKTARSTTYVIDEGRIDSPLCFTLSKYKCDKTVWITPNGWKTASIACGALFTCECRIVQGAMQFRFARVVVDNERCEEQFGQWDGNMVAAFASLDHLFARDMQTNLSKVSKQLIAAVYCQGVQQMLVTGWEQLKRALPAGSHELTSARALEAHPRRCELPLRDPEVEDAAHLLAAVSASIANNNNNNKHQSASHSLAWLWKQRDRVLTRTEILGLFRAVEPATAHVAVGDLLVWLEAGLGCRLDLLLQFMQCVEECVHNVWKQVQFRVPLDVCLAKALLGRGSGSGGWTLERCLQQQTQDLAMMPPIEVRACLYVFSSMCVAYPTADCLHKEKGAKEFLHRLTQLPDLAFMRQCVAAEVATEEEEEARA